MTKMYKLSLQQNKIKEAEEETNTKHSNSSYRKKGN